MDNQIWFWQVTPAQTQIPESFGLGIHLSCKIRIGISIAVIDRKGTSELGFQSRYKMLHYNRGIMPWRKTRLYHFGKLCKLPPAVHKAVSHPEIRVFDSFLISVENVETLCIARTVLLDVSVEILGSFISKNLFVIIRCCNLTMKPFNWS